jgi:hypothetical protein
LEILFSPDPLPLFPLSQVVQDVCPPPLLCPKQQWAPFFREFGKNPCRPQKVLVSNLGLTVFVSIWLNWLNRFSSLPPGGKKKQLKGRDLMVFSVFVPYHSKSLQTLSLFS